MPVLLARQYCFPNDNKHKGIDCYLFSLLAIASSAIDTDQQNVTAP